MLLPPNASYIKTEEHPAFLFFNNISNLYMAFSFTCNPIMTEKGIVKLFTIIIIIIFLLNVIIWSSRRS